ncbi:MAG: hypothetical protein Q9217_003855 [Psora testacea]
MSLATTVIEYTAEKYCHLCQSIFSQPDSFQRLVESEEGFAHYDLEELEHNPAAREILNRPRQRDPNSDHFYQTVHGWLHDCLHEHAECVRERNSLLPSRVLDVGDVSRGNNLRLHLSAMNERGRYIALSYCWGKAQSVTTNTHNVKEYSQRLPLDALHQSVRDAVIVTRKLNIRYLWVDALCILQDDAEDKAKEINVMCDIYKNAFLTIVASRANNVDDGFLSACLPPFKSDQPDVRYRFPYYCKDNRIGEIWLETIYGETHPEPLNMRGWALQEGVLSPRALIYKPSSVEWQCFRSGHRYKGNFPRELLTADTTPIDDVMDQPDSKAQASIRSEIWEAFIEDYTQRCLSFSEDKLPAVAGIASQLNKTWCDKYLAGLWQTDILRQLAWQNRQHLRSTKTKSPLVVRPRPPVYRAPSWSWASIDDKIFFFGGCKEFDANAEFLGGTFTPVSPAAPMGQVKISQISLRAASISSRDAVVTDALWQWSWRLDDGLKALDDSKYPAATYIFLGYIIKHTIRDRKSNEFDRQATGLILAPAGNDAFQRIGMFLISEPGEYQIYSKLLPAKEGSEVRRRIFKLV